MQQLGHFDLNLKRQGDNFYVEASTKDPVMHGLLILIASNMNSLAFRVLPLKKLGSKDSKPGKNIGGSPTIEDLEKLKGVQSIMDTLNKPTSLFDKRRAAVGLDTGETVLMHALKNKQPPFDKVVETYPGSDESNSHHRGPVKVSDAADAVRLAHADEMKQLHKDQMTQPTNPTEGTDHNNHTDSGGVE